MAPTPRIYIDRTQLDRKIAHLKANTPAAGEATIRELLEISVDSLIQFSKPFSDTNRYLNGWIQAGISVGVNRPLEPIDRPKRFAEFRSSLRRQMEEAESLFKFWSSRVSGMEKRNGHARWKSYRDAKKKLSKAVDIYDRAIENFEQFEETKGTGVIVFGKKFDRRRISTLDRAIFKVYGGSGRVFNVSGRWFGELRNAEPHARLVEKKHRVASRTKARTRQIGARTASKKYLESLTAGTGVIRRAA